MNWEDILKNIQISSQKTGSRNYVKPDEDEEVPDVEQNDEDCRQWWEDLMDMLDELLNYITDSKYKKAGFRGNVDSLSRAQQCEAKQKIIEGEVGIVGRFSFKQEWYKYERRVYRFGSKPRELNGTFLRFTFDTNDDNKILLRPTLTVHIVIDGKYIYDKNGSFNLDHDISTITGNSVAEKISKHIEKPAFSRFIEEVDIHYIGWGDSQDALEKSTIQIGSQKTSSRDYVKPEDDDEDCFKWWRGLFAILDRLILAVDKNHTSKEHDFGNLTNEYLCQKKEEMLNEPVKFYSAVTGYLKYGGPPSGINAGLSIAIEDYRQPQLFVGVKLREDLVFYNEEIPIQLEENTADVKTYTNAAVFEVVKKFHVAELDLMQYVNIDGDPKMTAKLIEIYDDYLREKFDVKKNIQISSQKTSSRDYVKPDEDDEDCREWWRELHRIFNKMINAIDRNATLIIDNQVEKADNQLLCELRDEILRKDIVTNFSKVAGYGKTIGYGKEIPNKGGAFIFGQGISDEPNPLRKSKLNFQSELFLLGRRSTEYLFNHSVSVWNDSILYELNKLKKRGEVYAYNVVEPFLELELKLKKHINDPNPAPFIAMKLIAIYETYLNSDVKKSITIGSQKTSSRNYVKPDEPSCKEQVLNIADKIMAFENDNFNMDNPIRIGDSNKFYINGYYEGMPSEEINEADRLSLETHFIESVDEETCCLILETIDKYKGQNYVEVEVRAPKADGYDKGYFIYTKEITYDICIIQIFFPAGMHIAATLSIRLHLKDTIPQRVIQDIEDIFESR